MRTIVKQQKGQAVTQLVVAAIIVGLMVGITYTILSPAWTLQTIANETVTVTGAGYVDLTNYDAVAGSEVIYNATNTSVTVQEGPANAEDCGNPNGVNETCYYNLTDGDKITPIRFWANRTGAYLVSYQYRPPSYSHNPVDRTILPLFGTFLILGVVVVMAKHFNLI